MDLLSRAGIGLRTRLSKHAVPGAGATGRKDRVALELNADPGHTVARHHHLDLWTLPHNDSRRGEG